MGQLCRGWFFRTWFVEGVDGHEWGRRLGGGIRTWVVEGVDGHSW